MILGKNFSNLKVILVEHNGPLNVGSVARLCSNFEVDELRIVSPKCNIFSLEAKKMALKGQKYLDKCKIFENLEKAIFDCDLVLASCGRIDISKDSFFESSEDISNWISSFKKINNTFEEDNSINIRGARQHNLKNIDLSLPRNKFIVFTGVSGSGKSSLAFDTIFAEGQRRYVESLSAYARQFLGQVDKPDVDNIEGLSPAISIDQKSTSHNPRSTVGTVTEIQDYLRLLFGRAGEPHCHHCGIPIAPQTIDEMVDQIHL